MLRPVREVSVTSPPVRRTAARMPSSLRSKTQAGSLKGRSVSFAFIGSAGLAMRGSYWRGKVAQRAAALASAAMKPTLRAAVAACLVLLLCVVLAEAIGPASAAPPLSAAPTAAAATGAARPPIVQDPIPFGPKRKREMAAYSERHYGEHTWRLTHPHVIVEHMSEASSVAADFNTFADDVPDVELHELPQVCPHFVVGSSGRIFQMVNLRPRCRHTVGLNWTAIGIEHIGYPDSDVLDN